MAPLSKSFSLFFFSLLLWVQRSNVSGKLYVLKGAVAEGAVCLDGSPPAYDMEEATTAQNARNWLLYLGGGGWCLNSTIYHTDDDSVQSCADRAKGDLGSSRHMTPFDFKSRHVLAHFSNESYFYNWNRVVVRYCDGGSFAGDSDKLGPVTNLYYRGARIFRAVINDLMARGMRDASNVLFAGGSAGGLGVMIHCDRFRRQFPKNVRVKCHADSSLFLRVRDPRRAKFFDTVFGNVVDVHRPENALPAACTSKNGAKTCFFPQTLLRYVKSPLFILNPAFDSFQVENTFSKVLHDQVENHTVSPRDMALLQDFRKQIIGALPPASDRNKGYVITSIFGHSLGTGIGYKGPMFADRRSMSFETALLDWFFDRSAHVNFIDPANEPFYERRPAYLN